MNENETNTAVVDSAAEPNEAPAISSPPPATETPIVETPPVTETPPTPSTQASLPPGKLDPETMKIPCGHCNGTGIHKWLSKDNENRPVQRQGKCYKCAPDRMSPAKGYLDGAAMLKNRMRDIRAGNVKFKIYVQVENNNQIAKGSMEFANGSDVYVVEKGDTLVLTKPNNLKVGDTVVGVDQITDPQTNKLRATGKFRFVTVTAIEEKQNQHLPV